MRRLKRVVGLDGWYRGRWLFIFFLAMLILLDVSTHLRLVDIDDWNSQKHNVVPDFMLWIRLCLNVLIL